MIKKRALILGSLALMVFILSFVIKFIVGTTFASESFPLNKKWSARLGESVQELSLVDDQIALARTPGSLYALNVQSGKILWHAYLNWQTIEKPAFARDGAIFLRMVKRTGAETVGRNRNLEPASGWFNRHSGRGCFQKFSCCLR